MPKADAKRSIVAAAFGLAFFVSMNAARAQDASADGGTDAGSDAGDAAVERPTDAAPPIAVEAGIRRDAGARSGDDVGPDNDSRSRRGRDYEGDDDGGCAQSPGSRSGSLFGPALAIGLAVGALRRQRRSASRGPLTARSPSQAGDPRSSARQTSGRRS